MLIAKINIISSTDAIANMGFNVSHLVPAHFRMHIPITIGTSTTMIMLLNMLKKSISIQAPARKYTSVGVRIGAINVVITVVVADKAISPFTSKVIILPDVPLGIQPSNIIPKASSASSLNTFAITKAHTGMMIYFPSEVKGIPQVLTFDMGRNGSGKISAKSPAATLSLHSFNTIWGYPLVY